MRSRELGLSRLARRRDGTVDGQGAPIAQPGRYIAHVALIYTPCEEAAPDQGSLLETAAAGLVAMENYVSPQEAVRMTCTDIHAILNPPTTASDDPSAQTLSAP